MPAQGTQSRAPVPAERPLPDRWLLSELNILVREVDAAMDGFDTLRAGRLLSAFVDDLSNWYVRRSRRRFWRGDPAALATLHEAITTVTLLLAPITPFVTERVWQDFVVPVTPDAAESVHLATYPVADHALIDTTLSAQMALVRRLVELGRAGRADAAVKTRQPLSRVLVSAPEYEQLPAELLAQIAEELNVIEVQSLAGADDSLVDTTAKANFRALGKRFGKGVQDVAAAIAATDATALKVALRATGSASVTVNGEPVAISADEVFVTETPREGWAIASDAGATVALDLNITEELRRAGVAREVIRQVQEARKSSGLDVADRIVLRFATADPETAAALAEHSGLVAEEVLATELAVGDPTWADPAPFADDALGLTFWLRKV
jgi:isoleucyl-tRNA synthetase